MNNPISLSPQSAVYETAIRYAGGAALVLSGAAIVTLFPPVAGVLGVSLGGKTVVVLSTTAFVSLLAVAWLGFAAVVQFRSGLSLIFQEKVAEKTQVVNATNKEIKGEKERYEKALKEKGAEIERLSGEIGKVRGERDRFEKAAAEIQAEADRLGSELGKKSKEVERLSREMGEKKNEIEQLGNELGRKQGEIEQLGNELGRKQAEAERLGSELGEKKAEVERLSKDLGDKQARLDTVARELMDKNKLLKELREEVEELRNKKNETDDFAEKNVELERRIHQLNQELEKALTVKHDRKEEVKQAQGLAKVILSKDAEIAALKRAQDELKAAHTRDLAKKERDLKSESDIEIDSLSRKLNRLEDELSRDKKKLSGDISRLEKELDEEKRGLRQVQDAHTQEKLSLETQLKGEIDSKEKEIEALRQSVETIRHEKEKEANEKEQALLLKIRNLMGDMTELRKEYDTFHGKVAQDVDEHEADKKELALSRKRIQDFIQEQSRLREANNQLKEERENNVEILELRIRLRDLEGQNEDYQSEMRGKVGRIQSLEKQVADLEIELANLKGQPIESARAPAEPSRWSIRKKELDWESRQPKEIVNTGQDSKTNSYNIVPQHRLDVESVFSKFKRGEECDHLELMTLYKEVERNHKASCEKAKRLNNSDIPNRDFNQLFCDLSKESSVDLLKPILHKFIKIGVYYLDSDTLKALFVSIKPYSTLSSLNSLFEGYLLRILNGLGLAHDTTLEAALSHYTALCEKNVPENTNHTYFFEGCLALIHKNSDTAAHLLAQMNRLKLLSDTQAAILYERCLSHFAHPDTNPLCIFLKERVKP